MRKERFLNGFVILQMRKESFLNGFVIRFWHMVRLWLGLYFVYFGNFSDHFFQFGNLAGFSKQRMNLLSLMWSTCVWALWIENNNKKEYIFALWIEYNNKKDNFCYLLLNALNRFFSSSFPFLDLLQYSNFR
jgi:hypothetical protein